MDLMELLRKKTNLDYLKTTFHFLVSEYGYELLSEARRKDLKGPYLLEYRNKEARKQLEICGSDSYFHCIIRRIDRGQLFPYRDHVNNLGFQTLAIADDHNYDHLDYYAGGNLRLKGVAQNTQALFKRQRNFLTGKDWLMDGQFQSTENPSFQEAVEQAGTGEPDFYIAEIKRMVDQHFPELKLHFYSLDLPFYHRDSLKTLVAYNYRGATISIEQRDWRDYADEYTLFVNGTSTKEVSTAAPSSPEQALRALKETLEQLDFEACRPS